VFKFCFFERITIVVIAAGHIQNFPRWEHSTFKFSAPPVAATSTLGRKCQRDRTQDK
jgi:hypothetical protein